MAAETVREAGSETTIWMRDLEEEGEIVVLAADVAALVGPGDLVTLSGDLGAGKTAWRRALIRLLTDEPDLEVPSPAFTLMQVYEGENFTIVHADFYRIEKPQELVELGLEESCEDALVLVEWPERAGDLLGADRLDIGLKLDKDRRQSYRAVTLTGMGSFAPRLARAKAIHDILERSGWNGAEREPMQTDASTRSYERLVKSDGQSAIPQ